MFGCMTISILSHFWGFWLWEDFLSYRFISQQTATFLTNLFLFYSSCLSRFVSDLPLTRGSSWLFANKLCRGGHFRFSGLHNFMSHLSQCSLIELALVEWLTCWRSKSSPSSIFICWSLLWSYQDELVKRRSLQSILLWLVFSFLQT